MFVKHWSKLPRTKFYQNIEVEVLEIFGILHIRLQILYKICL